MPERTLVRVARSRSHGDRELATGIQRGETEEVTGRANTYPVRTTDGHKADYNAGKLYINPLLKAGGRRKTNIPDGVFTLPGFLAYVGSHAAEVMSINRVQFCVGRLETARLSITKATDVEHVQRLRRWYGNDQ